MQNNNMKQNIMNGMDGKNNNKIYDTMSMKMKQNNMSRSIDMMPPGKYNISFFSYFFCLNLLCILARI